MMRMLLAGSALWCVVIGEAAAQEVAEAAGGEILVTAQKRAQSVQDVPVSITAIGGGDLNKLQANDVSSISTQIPNVVATVSINLPAFTIRGVGLNELASNYDAPVAVHIDEVYRSKPYMVSVPFFDIDRVEALKGPQGTLFGRNTTGGSVNFYTAEPKMRNEGWFNVVFDNHGRARVEGATNLMLSDQLAVRGSYFVAQGAGGPYRNLLTGNDYGAPNQLAGRLQLKWESGGTTVKLSGYMFRDKSELTPFKSPGIYTPAGTLCPQILDGSVLRDRTACLKFGPFTPLGSPPGLRETHSIRETNANYGWHADNVASGITLRVEQDLGTAVLTSVTSRDLFRRSVTEDADNSPSITVDDDYYSRINQFSEELRLSGETGSLQYMIGGYYEKDGLDEVNTSNFRDNPIIVLPPNAPRLAAQFRQDVRSLALFTHNELKLGDQISLVGGIRYTSDRTAIDGTTFLGADDPRGVAKRITPVVPVDAAHADRTDENISFRGGINWSPGIDNMLYISVSRGFRSGGYALPNGGSITSFDPEKLTAYEVGYKTRLFDRRVDLNTVAFYYEYEGLQVNVDDPVSPIVPTTRNIGSSRTYGAELDLSWRPDSSFVAKLGVGYLDARIKKSDRFVTTYAGPIALAGKRPVNTPEWTIQASAEKRFELSSDLSLTLQTDGKYTAERFLEITNQPFDRAPGYWLQSARITLSDPDDRWELALWGRNIFNKEYLTYLNNVSFFRIEIYGEPASYGLSGRFRF